MQFDYHSSRSRQARIRSVLQKKFVINGLWVLAVFSFVAWLYLVFITKQPLGNFLLFIFTPSVMLPTWFAAHLNELPANNKMTSIDGILSAELLGILKKDINLVSLAEVISKTNGARFFGSRFAISSLFIKNTIDESTKTIEQIWQKAAELSKKYNESSVSSAAVFVSLLTSIPEHEYYLAQLKLSAEDVESGLAWHQHIGDVIKSSKQSHSGGGIGRDLSFGYTPLLSRFGFNISQEVQSGGLLHRDIEGHEEVLAQVMHLLSQPGRRNAALVGSVGVGKTTLVYALAKKIQQESQSPNDLRYRQIIALDSSTLIANSRGSGQLEEILIRIFNEAAKAKNVVIFLDEAQLFLKSGTGSVDLSSILLPVLEGGGIRIILSLDDQEWLRLSQRNPGLAQLINRVVVQPLSQPETMLVIEDQVLLLELRNDATYMYQSLNEAYKLADRYITDQAFPGKAVKLLESAAAFKEQQYFVTEKSVQQAVEKAYGVKVQTANTQDDKDVLLNLEGRIHERMINQTRAVKVVSDALRRSRAGVRNQQKPIGTFLFLGPTGVGKTELSKSLAAVYFGGEENMIRVDLNEYSSPNDVARLLASPADNSESLTAQISKQPYSVVLLDEIEKAHPNVLNVLLQMLDEGSLRDTNNKVISFKDSIIIATSNAGAEEIRAHIEAGEELEQFEQQFIDNLINKNLFKSELLNRFDEIVLFRPLKKEELLQVVDLIIYSLNKTLSAQKVSVELTQNAKQMLVDNGYDPRLGARPLRRVVQRSVENIVANKLLSNQTFAGSKLVIDDTEIKTALSK